MPTYQDNVEDHPGRGMTFNDIKVTLRAAKKHGEIIRSPGGGAGVAI